MSPVQALPAPGTAAYRSLVSRGPVPEDVRLQTQTLLLDVQRRGDTALLELTERFDGVRLARTRVSSLAIGTALADLDAGLRAALDVAAAHIESVHRAQLFREEPVEVIRGVRVWREWRPLHRVGIYVPGGRTVYPSSVLMLAIPARLAGCQEIVLCSPPQRDGEVAPAILAAAGLAGVTEVHAIGGAQAIAAMAYGTESVPRVDKIFGPGNAYVTAAKLLVFGEVAVDMPAGPSEILILTDGSVPAPWVAADLRAQAEHAPDARAVLVSTDQALAAQVCDFIDGDLANQVRVLTASDMEPAVAFANDFAPEHLTLACAGADRWLPRISAAGSVFVGPFAAAAAGDYATGANHVLPTGGASRSFSALGVDAFGRRLQVQWLNREGLRALEPVVDAIASAERMTAHGESVRARHAGTASDPELSGLTTDADRSASRRRQTQETDVSVRLRLDGRGTAQIATGAPFLDHLLRALAMHARFDLEVQARGDLEVDAHHTVEDVALVLGEALAAALGDRAGIARFGDAIVPLDASRATVALDVGGRGFALIDLPLQGSMIGSLPATLVPHFLETFAVRGGVTLHVTASGRDDHHLAEATFKALARALRQACAADLALRGRTPSTK